MTRAVTLAELPDSAVLTVNSSNSRIGIGSTQPTVKLDVTGDGNVSGTLTATSFSGDGTGLTGVASTDNIITGTAATFTGGINANSINVTGLSTFVGFVAFTTSISVGGTVTYEDVTNIDSVGIITARSHVSIADSILHTGDTDTSIRFPAANTFTVETGGSERLRVNSSGNVGIGTDNPGQKLHVLGDGSTAVQVSDGTNNQYFASIATADNFSNGSVAGDALIRGQSGFSVSPNNGSSVKLRVDSSGRVLIGGTSSTGNAVLTVQGLAGNTAEQGTFALRRSSGNGNNNKIGVIEFSGGDNNQAALIQGVGDNTWGTDDYPGRLEFYTTADGASTPTERLRVDSSGRMLIGATSAVSGADANGLLQVSQDVGNNTCIIVAENTASSGNLSCFRARLRNSSPDSIFSAFLQCDDSSAGSKAVIRSNGGLANFSANNVNLSDRNVKKDITAAAGTWNSIKNWEIVNFRYKEQPDDADLNLGVIAQQIEEVSPEMVTIFQQAKEATETEPACEQRLGVKEQQMQWAVIKALQEAMARIETLETQNAALEARLTALEGS